MAGRVLGLQLKMAKISTYVSADFCGRREHTLNPDPLNPKPCTQHRALSDIIFPTGILTYRLRKLRK